MSGLIILGTVAAYFGLLLLISRFTGKKADNDTFFRGNRQSPWYLVAFGMIGTSLSGVSFVSVPGMVAYTQMTYLQMCIGFFFGYLAVAYVLLPLYYRMNLTSIYSYLHSRFGPVAHQTGAGFFLLSKMVGAAARLYLTCLILQRFVFDEIGVPYTGTVLITLFLVWLYTRRNGIRTLVWTDAIQTLCLVTALIIILGIVASRMGLDMEGLWHTVRHSTNGRIFVFDDWISKQNFWKQFFSGVFIVIVMTGLDQDMMQKNLTCKNLKDAQKDMCSYGFCFIPINFLFLALGVLLYIFVEQQGIQIPNNSDDLLPMLASEGYLGASVLILFTIGIVAAAFSSVDSALTALTTTFCIDILGIERKNLEKTKAERLRRQVHLWIVIVFTSFTLLFKSLNNTSVIDSIYIMASYTYGPLLGLFCFGLFTRRIPRDRYVPIVAISSPIICYLLNIYIPMWTGYSFGYELLMLNGMLTFAGLWCLSNKRQTQTLS